MDPKPDIPSPKPPNQPEADNTKAPGSAPDVAGGVHRVARYDAGYINPQLPEWLGYKNEKTPMQDAQERLMKFVEGEPLGSVKSKAFCDAMDQRIWDSEYAATESDNEKDQIDRRIALIQETTRQRRNEIPGYSAAINEVFDMTEVVRTAYMESDDIKIRGERGEKVAERRTADVITAIKEDYIIKASKPPTYQPSSTTGIGG